MGIKISMVQECFNGKQKRCELLYHLFRLTISLVINEGINRQETTTNLAIVAYSSCDLDGDTFVGEEGKELF